ncbi:MAG TPA: gamma-glutamyltransferase family protein [Thermoleophilaceae bacterium]|jgi:gamma-glutamyltranspeptidase/glutathione hydrolase
MRITTTVSLLLVMGLLALPPGAAAQPQKEPTAVGSGGAAASVDLLGTRAAIRTLRRGGNAVDAAVAAASVLGVTEPYSCGIGGGGFMVIRTAKGKVTTIDGREESPRAMRPDSFWQNGAALAFDPARYSGMSFGVPGTPATWQLALRRYGTWSLGRALRPGIRVARDGFTVDSTFVSQTQPNVDWFNDIPSTAAIYLDEDGTPRDEGSTLRNPDLARTYRLLGREGVDAFYTGALARAMADAAQNPPKAADANHAWLPGLMTRDDLRRYRAIERRPSHHGYRGLEVWGMGPPSSGGSTVGEELNILEGYRGLAADRVRALHLMLEASRFTFADRNAYLADPDFFDVPLAGLLSDSFAAERRALIDEEHAATSPVAPGNPYDNQRDHGRARRGSATISHPRQSTTHLVVSDRKGNVVSYTFTIESTGGNAIVVPGYGFLMNNELTDFNYDSTTHPNRADGDKRPRSSMSPTIVTRHGRPFIAVGSPGGSTIPGTVLQVLLERLDLGKSLPEAIATPRAVQRNAATSTAEPAFISSPEGQALIARGHSYTEMAEIGAVTGIEFLPGGRTLAAAEPVRRGGGSAAVARP